MKEILIVLAVIVIAIQFIPVERTNPPVTGDIGSPANVSAILRNSCYDCHSNETTWPWYSYVAPVSFLVADDVKEGREHMNFSEWDKYSGKDQRELMEEIVEEIEKGEMPLKIYAFTHPDAEMDDAKLKVIRSWVGSGTDVKGEVEFKQRYKDED